MLRVAMLLLLGAVFAQARASEPVVRLIADESVLAGKLQRLESLAAQSGVRLEWAYAGALPEAADKWLAAADLLIIEAPLQSARQRVEEKVGEALARSRVPRVEVASRRQVYSHLPASQAQAFIAYYHNGGEANLRNFFVYLRTWKDRGNLADVPLPMLMPDSGYYHPDASQPFASMDDYLRWGRSRWKSDAPRVALAIHASTIAGMQTRLLDAFIQRSEALGQMPLAFWFDSEDPDALKKIARQARPDVLINMQHMGNGQARTAEFLQLDIPVLQTLNYRDSDIAQWQEATSGAPARLVAPFIAVYEIWGMSDPMTVSAVENDELAPIPEQVDAVLRKASQLAALRHTPAADKRLALLFWNYPPGEKNFSASNLNVPRSLESLTSALQAAGYDVPARSEQQIIAAGQAMLGVLYRHETLDALLEKDMAGTLPVKRYREWLATLTPFRREELLEHWGDPAAHWAVRNIGGEKQFVIPRWQQGKLLMMPQMPRGAEPGSGYHDAAMPPDHYYLAAYLYAREIFAPHALIHFGTHGTQEWLPGKDRGLSVQDYPLLAVGDVPVFYPYIQDNIGEALQAKRRGRAVIVSHQTPPFAPSGLYEELVDVHALLHEYIQLDPGAVRDRTAERLRGMIVAGNLHQDIDWTEAAMAADFDAFMTVFHDHLHQLARRTIPLGLHSLGTPPAAEHRLSTVVQQLGDEFAAAAARADAGADSSAAHAGHPGMQSTDDSAEFFSQDFSQLQSTPPYRLLQRHLRDQAPLAEIEDVKLRALVKRGVELDQHLANNQELPALLAGLAGRFVAPGPGGDPVRNPDVPNGRNLYGFEPDKLPTRSAYDAAEQALDGLIRDYRSKHAGETPGKLAFSLWSVEAMRHMGVTESQVLRAMGLRPRWDEGGRVTGLDIIPLGELGRPRIDAVVQVTGAYRDQFEGFMRLLAQATQRLSTLEEPDNAIARNTRATMQSLLDQGLDPAQAGQLAAVRLFGNQPGDYGVGLSDAVLDSTAWENDAPLAEQYLSRLQYAYGSGENGWAVRTPGVNVFAEQLKGVQAAVLSRSSNLYGVLTGDDPYQFLGGMSLAIRHLSGTSPELYISDQRQQQGRMISAAGFLAEEMRTRYLNPQWITTMQQEGYAGTLEIVDTLNNLWGWQAMDSSTVRADQWQAMHDVYIMDKYQLDMQQWFEKHNATAQAQLLERMLEAIRKDYWDAPEQTRREIVQRWEALADRGITTGKEKTREFAREMAAGFGLQSATLQLDEPAAPAQQTPDEARAATPSDAPAHTVRGQVMQESNPEPAPEASLWRLFLAIAALLLCLIAGGLHQLRPFFPDSQTART